MKKLTFFGLLPLLLMLAASPSFGQAPNFSIIVENPSWVPAFTPLVDWLEADFDYEGGRSWVVEVVALSDTSAVKNHLQARKAALNGGDLFAMIVSDPSHSASLPWRQYRWQDFAEDQQEYVQRIAGYDIGWGDFVPSIDHWCDPDGDHQVDIIAFVLPAHSYGNCQQYIEGTNLQQRFNVQWAAAKQPPGVKRMDLGPPAEALASPKLSELWWDWAAAADSIEVARGKSGPGYLSYVTVICEDAWRDGRNGDVVRDHGLAIRDQWTQGNLNPVYLGDPDPYNIWVREAAANEKDNWGHQVKIALGTTANKVNMIYFQDHRSPTYWRANEDLEANYCFYLHIGLSCALAALDRADNPAYGRPHFEDVLFVPYRGAFAALGFTRQAVQFTHFGMGQALSNVAVPRMTSNPYGASVGRIWKDGRNDFAAVNPQHWIEASSFIGVGDPTLKLFEGYGAVVAVNDDPPRIAFNVSAAPNPFNPMTTIKFSLPSDGPAGLSIFDVRGRRVAELLPYKQRSAGHYSITWTGKNNRGESLASGVYFAQVNLADDAKTTKLLLVR